MLCVLQVFPIPVARLPLLQHPSQRRTTTRRHEEFDDEEEMVNESKATKFRENILCFGDKRQEADRARATRRGGGFDAWT
jgi:hypothetical protein